MRPVGLPNAVDNDLRTGEAFFKQAVSYNWRERDSLALEYANAGQVPDFYFNFVPVTTTFKAADGKEVDATFYVAPDYFMVGSNTNWARVHSSSANCRCIRMFFAYTFYGRCYL
jgi:hypothetical protein